MKHRIGGAAGVAAIALLMFAPGAFASGKSEAFGFKSVRGSGTVRSELRDVAGFNGIVLSGSGNVHVSPGADFRVEVVADDNLLEYITTELRDGKLVLGTKPGTMIRRVSRLEFNISMPELQSATIEGSGDIDVTGTARGDRLALSIRGSGNIRTPAEVSMLTCTIAGSGDINVKGSADSQTIRVEGSGNVNNRDVSADKVEVTIAGSGDVWVNAEKSLEVDVVGSGNLHYRGNARPSIRAAGSGKVTSF